MEVKIEESDKKGRAYVGEASAVSAEMTFSKAGTKLLIIDHTEVGEEHRGQGVGKKLLYAIVELARERAIKIIALCPYAKSVFDKEEAIRDVLQ